MADKKETQLILRVDTDLKKSFLQACKKMDRNGSQMIRDFMREFVRKNGQKDMFK